MPVNIPPNKPASIKRLFRGSAKSQLNAVVDLLGEFRSAGGIAVVDQGAGQARGAGPHTPAPAAGAARATELRRRRPRRATRT